MHAEQLKSVVISDSGFIPDPVTGSSLPFNAIGIETINHLKSGTNSEEIAGLPQEASKVSQEDAELDPANFMGNLKGNHLS